MVGGVENDELWGSGRGAIAGSHCSVLWLGASVTTNFGGVDTAMAPRKSTQKNCLGLLADVTLFSTLIPQKLFFAIWGLCWFNFFFKFWFSWVQQKLWGLSAFRIKVWRLLKIHLPWFYGKGWDLKMRTFMEFTCEASGHVEKSDPSKKTATLLFLN